MIIDAETPYWMTLAHTSVLSYKQKNVVVDFCLHNSLKLSDFLSDDAVMEAYAVQKNMDKDIFKQVVATVGEWKQFVERQNWEGYTLVSSVEPEYPQHMKRMMGADAPLLVYCYGDVSVLNQDAIALVGSRDASEVSLHWAERIAMLKGAQSNRVVVSGYARGVDRAAMSAAMNIGGKTIAVLPQGIDTFLSEHSFSRPFIQQGALILFSTYPPFSKWQTLQALERNVFIYALAEQTYVAESGNHGGTWDGAHRAMKLVWQVYVRRPEMDENNANSLLIEHGAVPVDSEGNVLERQKSAEEIEAERINSEIIHLLNISSYTAKDLISRLQLDWSAAKMSHYLQSIDDIIIENCKPKRYTLKKATDLTLF